MSALNAAVRTATRTQPSRPSRTAKVDEVCNTTWNASQVARLPACDPGRRPVRSLRSLALRGLRRGEASDCSGATSIAGLVRIERQVTGSGSTLSVGDPKSIQDPDRRRRSVSRGLLQAHGQRAGRVGPRLETLIGSSETPKETPSGRLMPPADFNDLLPTAAHRFVCMTCATPRPPSGWPAAKVFWR